MESRNATGVAALLVGLGAVMAQAQDYSYLPPDAGPVFRMGIGPSFFENGELTQFGVPVSSPVTYQPGVAFDAAFGWAFNRYVALDFESGYIGARIDNVPGYTSDDSYLYNIPFLANVTLSCPIPRTIVVPYIGVGAGGADVIFDTDNFADATDTVVGRENDVVFAWQAFAGLRFRLARNLSLGVGYQYFATADPTFTYPPDNFSVKFDGVKTHSVMAALEWKFW